jgi:DNA (cytosine-5)-methyltransferase 1
LFLLAIEGAGNWRTAAEILFERKSLCGDIEEGDKEGEGVASDVGEGVETGGRGVAFRKSKRAGSTTDYETWVEGNVSNTLNNFDLGDTRTTHAVVYENHPNDSRVTGPHDVAPTVVSRFGTGGGNVPFVNQEPITFQPGNLRRDAGADPSTQATTTLKATPGDQMPHIAYSIREDAKANNFSATPLEVTPALQALRPSVQSHHAQTFVAQSMAVRRLTPVECERLQGFPDNYSQIPWKGKPADQCPDGPRYKACGNSMAVPVMRWIGERIQKYVDGTLNK